MGRRVIKPSRIQTPTLFDANKVPPISEQVRRGLQAEADRKYAEEMATWEQEKRAGKTPLKRKPSKRTVRTPIVRLGPHALCYRDRGYLEHVTEFDYDLTDPVFCAYATSRGQQWQFISGPYAQAGLQDCWELYPTDREQFLRRSSARHQPEDIVVIQRPKDERAGDIKVRMFEVILPRMTTPGKLFLAVEAAVQYAKRIAKESGVSVWYRRTEEGAQPELLETYRGLPPDVVDSERWTRG